MSQAGSNSAGNGSTGIQNIAGNIGTATGNTVTIRTDTGLTNGSTALFTAGGSTSILTFDDANSNLGIGTDSLGFADVTTAGSNTCVGTNSGKAISNIATGNTGLGTSSLQSLSGVLSSYNTAIGAASLGLLTTTSYNTAIGAGSLGALVTGRFNCAFGYTAGGNYTTSESSNITIGYNLGGIAAESNTLRIATATGTGDGQLNAAYINGITSTTSLSSPKMVVINTSDSKLGAYALGGSISVVSIDVADSPYTVIAGTDVCILVDSSGGAVTVRLPNSTGNGNVFFIKDLLGNAATNNITITTPGGLTTIDGNAAFVMNTAYESVQVVFYVDSYSII
jgi:hypothetical protein